MYKLKSYFDIGELLQFSLCSS